MKGQTLEELQEYYAKQYGYKNYADLKNSDHEDSTVEFLKTELEALEKFHAQEVKALQEEIDRLKENQCTHDGDQMCPNCKELFKTQ